MNQWKMKLGALVMAASMFVGAAPVSAMAAEVPANEKNQQAEIVRLDAEVKDPAPAPVTNYTVSYKVGDQVIFQENYAEGSTLVVTEFVPASEEGYEFVGWVEEEMVNTDAEKVSRAGDTIIVDRNITLVPKYNKIERPQPKLPVTLSYVVGPDTVSTVTYTAGDTVVVQYYYGSLSKDYIFIGWEDLATGILYTEGQSFVLTQNTQLVAVFAPAAAPAQFITELPKEEDYGAKKIGDDPNQKETIPAEKQDSFEEDQVQPQADDPGQQDVGGQQDLNDQQAGGDPDAGVMPIGE